MCELYLPGNGLGKLEAVVMTVMNFRFYKCREISDQPSSYFLLNTHHSIERVLRV